MTNVILFAWNRPIPGREKMSAEHFQDFVGYLGGLQQSGAIASHQVVLLNNHGGDMNGFFLIHGDAVQLGDLAKSETWLTHMTRAAIHLEGSGAVFGATGGAVMERMKLWTGLLPA